MVCWWGQGDEVACHTWKLCTKLWDRVWYRITLIHPHGIEINTSIELWKKKKCIYNANKACLASKRIFFFFFFIPISFFWPQSFCGVFKSIQIRFLSHTFKYSQACILLILLLWFIYLFYFLKNQIICLNCLYLDGSFYLTILRNKFIIQIICLNYLYL